MWYSYGGKRRNQLEQRSYSKPLESTYIATFLESPLHMHVTVQLTFSFNILPDRFGQSHVFGTTLSVRLVEYRLRQRRNVGPLVL